MLNGKTEVVVRRLFLLIVLKRLGLYTDPETRKLAAGSTIGPRIHTSHSDEENGPCLDLGACVGLRTGPESGRRLLGQ